MPTESSHSCSCCTSAGVRHLRMLLKVGGKCCGPKLSLPALNCWPHLGVNIPVNVAGIKFKDPFDCAVGNPSILQRSDDSNVTGWPERWLDITRRRRLWSCCCTWLYWLNLALQKSWLHNVLRIDNVAQVGKLDLMLNTLEHAQSGVPYLKTSKTCTESKPATRRAMFAEHKGACV